MGLFGMFKKKETKPCTCTTGAEPEHSQAEQKTNTAEAISKEEGLVILREKILASLEKTPETEYELASLLWADAASCFPMSCSWQWDGAWFKLNLNTGRLSAEVSTYPNQFGACRERVYELTPADFHQKAIKFRMSAELQAMETDKDWEALFDDRLKDAVTKAQAALQELEKQRKLAEQKANAVAIPQHFAKKQPTMEFDEIRLELQQKYGLSQVSLTQNKGQYILNNQYVSLYTSNTTHNTRELSPMEAAWLEHQVKNCMNRRDETTWQSLPGGDLMTVRICKQGKTCVDRNREIPLGKYVDLSSTLQNLSQYGSRI